MNKSLILAAFAKAEKELQHEGKNNPSLTEQATQLSVQLEDEYGGQIGERRLRDYRKAALETVTGDINIAQASIIDALCHYLGYEYYPDFCKDITSDASTPVANPTKKSKPFAALNNWLLLVPVLALAAIFIYNFATRQRYMIWQKDQFVEVSLEDYPDQVHRLKVYKEDKLNDFKKVPVTCDTVFFEPNGKVKFWYYKNRYKELELFTDVGRHPETGKTLKPITQYMIDKYICRD